MEPPRRRRAAVVASIIRSVVTLFATCSVARAAEPPIPPHWEAFLASPQDKPLVAEVKRLEWFTACERWGQQLRSAPRSRREAALRHMLRYDQTINGADQQLAPQGKVAIGMTACGVYAALGLPDAQNTTTTASSTIQQHVYRSRGVYVYTRGVSGDHNGRVTAIQYR
jgi:hypothetical protein